MARQLKAPVWIAGQWFRPGDPIPDEYAAQIGDHAWIDDGQPAAEQVTPPPLGGPGSGTEEWAAYAQSLGVEVPDDATTRGEIVDAVRDAGHPVE